MINKTATQKQRASILLVTLAAMILLFFFSVSIFYYYRNASLFRLREISLIQQQWATRSIFNLFFTAIQNKPDLFYRLEQNKKLSIKELPIKIQSSSLEKNIENAELHLEELTAGGNYRIFVFFPDSQRKTENALFIEKTHYFDYLFYFNKNIQLIAVEQPLRFFGPIYIAGNLQLGAYGAEIYFYKKKEISQPLLYSEGLVSEYPNLNRSEAIHFAISDLAITTQNPHQTTYKQLTWKQLKNSPNAEWFTDKKNGSQSIPFLSFESLSSYLQKQGKEIRSFSLDRRGNFSVKTLINPKLLTKEFLGAGTGSKAFFAHNTNQIPKRVYIRRLAANANNKVHPMIDLDNSTKPDQEVSYGSVHFRKEPIFLDLPDEAYEKFGIISLGGRNFSRIAQSMQIQELYLNGTSAQERLKEDQYIYDSTKKELILLKETYHHFFRKLTDEKADGVRRDFPTGSLNPAFGYVNGKKQKMTRIQGRIIFDTPPPRDADIGILTHKPDFYVRKELPLAGVGVYIDKPVAALYVRLEELSILIPGDVSSKKEIPVFHFYSPVFLEGSASDPMVLIVHNDLYLSDINTREESKAITLVSKGVVWAANFSHKPLEIRNTWFFSAGDQLFSVEEEPLPSPHKHLFYGSAVFAGTLANAFVEQDISNCYLYSIEYFENWNFIYNEHFQKKEKSPLGVPTAFSLKGIDW